MKKKLVYLLYTVVVLMISLGANARFAENAKNEETLRSLEDERVSALVAGDIGKLDHLFADDLIYTHATSAVQTKSEFLADLRSGKRAFKSMKHSDVQVRAYAEAGVVTGRSDYRFSRDGQEMDISVRFIEVFHKQKEGRWQMIAWQSTRIPN